MTARYLLWILYYLPVDLGWAADSPDVPKVLRSLVLADLFACG